MLMTSVPCHFFFVSVKTRALFSQVLVASTDQITAVHTGTVTTQYFRRAGEKKTVIVN